MKKLLGIIKERPSQFRDKKPDILLVSPPMVNEDTGYCRAGDKYLGATQKSKELAGVYEKLAANMDISFVSLSSVAPGIDGIHIDAEGHAQAAELIHQTLIN